MIRRSGGVYLGTAAAESGYHVLLEALDLFAGARVVVIPPGTPHAEVRTRMACAAYLVLPSLASEALPRALVEAFAHSLPVIASRIAGLVELVEPGRNGLLFEPGSARDLARRLAWAEAFPEKMRQMGECAQADYQSRFGADWSYQRLFGERRQYARAM
jgi:glycosyltransferase involved in cell wall biosynthesis